MSTRAFLESIRRRTGLDEDGATAAAEVTLESLGEVLAKNDRDRLATLVPAPFEDTVKSAKAGQSYGLDTFYERVARREGVETGFGLEHAQAVCQSLSQQLESGDRKYLVNRLPDEYDDLFAAPVVDEPGTSPGGDEFVEALSDDEDADSEPSSTGVPVQSGSVAAAENPHGNRKLSTGRGGPNEERDLATGRPGPSEGHDLATNEVAPNEGHDLATGKPTEADDDQ